MAPTGEIVSLEDQTLNIHRTAAGGNLSRLLIVYKPVEQQQHDKNHSESTDLHLWAPMNTWVYIFFIFSDFYPARCFILKSGASKS